MDEWDEGGKNCIRETCAKTVVSSNVTPSVDPFDDNCVTEVVPRYALRHFAPFVLLFYLTLPGALAPASWRVSALMYVKLH